MNNNIDSPRSFIKRLLSFSMGTILSSFIGFVYVPILTWIVSPEDIGKASFFTTIISLLTLFCYLGLDQSFIREYYENNSKSKLLFHTFAFSFIISCLMSIIIMLFGDGISLIIFNEKDNTLILLLALTIPIIVIDRYATLIVRMEEKAKLFSLFQVGQRILNVLSVFILLFIFERTFRSIIIAYSISYFAITIVKLVYVIRYISWEYLFKIDKILLKRILLYGLPTVVTVGFSWILNSMDKVALRMWSNFHELGLYSSAFKVIALLILIKQAFATFWTPTSYRWYNEDVPIEKFETVSKFYSFGIFLVCSFIISFRWILKYIFAGSFHESIEIIPVLIFTPIMVGISATTFVGINFVRKSYLHTIVSLLSASINLIGNFLLVPKYGAYGAAISTSFSYFVIFILRSLLSNKVWKKMRLHYHFINTAIFLAHVIFTLLFKNLIFINFIFIAIFVIVNIGVLKEIFKKFIFRKELIA